jgi:E3 ubiquitin-protein ligase HECTD2
MAPWPQRLNSNSSASNGPTTSAQPNPNKPLPPAPPSAADYEIPTLRRKPIHSTSDPAALNHSRSFSHPFPSLFGGGRKPDKKNPLKIDANIYDTTDDDTSINGDSARHNGTGKSTSRNTSQKGNKEPVTGKCMTCDSTVRWPQGLKVYRCTTCMTINDLEPFAETRNETVGLGGFGSQVPHRKRKSVDACLLEYELTAIALALSNDRTRSIIDHCIEHYLEGLLLPEQFPARPRHDSSPPPSPLFDDGTTPEAILFSQTQDLESPSPLSPSKKSEGSRQVLSPRPKLTARSPSDPSMTPMHPVRNGDRTLLPGFVPTSNAERPRTAGPQSADQPCFATAEQTGSDDEAGFKQQKASSIPIFRPLESYIAGCFSGCATLNTSFFTIRPQNGIGERIASGEQTEKSASARTRASNSDTEAPLSELDAKTLLLGDFAENGFWWTGSHLDRDRAGSEHRRPKSPESWKGVVTAKTPRINWAELTEWYRLVTQVGSTWKDKWRELCPDSTDSLSAVRRARWQAIAMDDIEREITESRIHAQRALLKSTENLLKRPRRPLKHPEDCRFLLILLANPLLGSYSSSQESRLRSPKVQAPRPLTNTSPTKKQIASQLKASSGPGHHSGIVKRLLGLISNLPNEVHQFMVSWFSRTSDSFVQRLVDLVGSFVTYRLSRQHSRKHSEAVNPTDGLVPSFSEAGLRHPSQLHAALEVRPASISKTADGKPKLAVYGEDWQIRAAARVMALLFAANTNYSSRKRDSIPFDQRMQSAGLNAKHQAHAHGQAIPISSFYNTMLDYADLVSDFETWESNRSKFSFCQYPFFLSIWAKIHILEHDARRQMEVKAREAFFDSIRGVSEVVGSGGEEIKKGLRIDFVGEEGVDAGGLRKEWFLLLVREIFDPHHGLFVYDEDSQFCYFNPYCFESSEQFFLVGVLLGLAIYNSTILDVAFPPFVFKKMLASAPNSNVPVTSAPRLVNGYTLEDLAEFRPALARGLRQLLEFEGDVQDTFCRNFVAEVDRYGDILEVPLCSNGENKSVTNSNRREFVELYIQYLLDSSVTRQYEPFKRGFFTVCGGNALSLFRPEEIELLIRGSDEPLDVPSLRAVAKYEGWQNGNKDAEKQPQVIWFWEFFERAAPTDQRKILSFITGSDRIPAMGATNLIIKVQLLSLGRTASAYGDTDRFPSARTCFNSLGLYTYGSKEKLEEKLWTAVSGSEGFGLK